MSAFVGLPSGRGGRDPALLLAYDGRRLAGCFERRSLAVRVLVVGVWALGRVGRKRIVYNARKSCTGGVLRWSDSSNARFTLSGSALRLGASMGRLAWVFSWHSACTWVWTCIRAFANPKRNRVRCARRPACHVWWPLGCTGERDVRFMGVHLMRATVTQLQAWRDRVRVVREWVARDERPWGGDEPNMTSVASLDRRLRRIDALLAPRRERAL